MNFFNRSLLVKALKEEEQWDVLIIGGGATGLGIAVDAVVKGFKTLLVEQDDFAKATSSRSTKLVHGGVRYLAQGNIGLVREALKERGILLKNAPHLTRNESFIIPCFSWGAGLFYAAGLTMYDWLAAGKSIGKSKFITKKEVEIRLPVLKRASLKCGVLYHDGIFDDARLALNLAQTAVEKSAVAVNYCKVVSLLKNEEQRICGATIIDKETKEAIEVKAKVVVNATGVFADDLLKMDRPESGPLIRPSQGIHLVLDHCFLQSQDAIMIPHTDDGRVLFAIPWQGKVLIGTTDTPLETPSLEPRALEKEIEFVLKTAGKFLSREPKRADVLSVFAGLRPLAASGDKPAKTKEISRSHKVIISESGLVSVIGGKWTTYRKMAEDAINKIMDHHLLPVKSGSTENVKIYGYSVNENILDPLYQYGSDKPHIEKLKKENEYFATPLSKKTKITVAQVIWAVRNEMARTVEDVLARRTRVLFSDSKLAGELAPVVADIMMKEFNYDQEWRKNQVDEFCQLARSYSLTE